MTQAKKIPNEIRMKLTSLLLLAVGALALAGCSSTPTHVDKGPIQARTFSFVNTGTKPPLKNVDNRQAAHALIQEAITKKFADAGVTRVESAGDVTVAYLIIVGDNVTTESISDYFGYGRDYRALHDKAHEVYTGSKNPNEFEAGTLLIDIIDSKSFKLLKRGHASRPMLKELPADARAARIQEVVNEILGDLRFAP